MRPLWVRLPPHVQDAISSRWQVVQDTMQTHLWDRIGWKAKPKKQKADADSAQTAASGLTAVAAELRAGMGSVVSLHSDTEWEAALALTKESDVRAPP